MKKHVALLICIFGLTNISLAQKSKTKILFVVSNQETYGDSDKKTGNHFGEIVYAYHEFLLASYTVDFVSPKGGKVRIGYIKDSDKLHIKYLEDTTLIHKLQNTLRPEQVVIDGYKAIYYVGGGAAMFGVPENEVIQNITNNIYKNNGVVSAVCHGTAGLVNIKTDDGNFIYTNKSVSGFPDKFENKSAAYYKTFPFSIENTINDNGGQFKYSKEGWDNFYIVDGRLITGQDPTASASVAKAVIKSLKQQKS